MSHTAVTFDETETIQRVLQAAIDAWLFAGAECRILAAPDDRSGIVACLIPLPFRQIEILVNYLAAADTWRALTEWPHDRDCTMRALVPRHLLGQAHENLRDEGFELQGWWLEDGNVAFSSAEIA